MNVENLMNSMTIEYKLEILARFFLLHRTKQRYTI